MHDEYIISIILAIKESDNNIIMVFQNKLTDEEMNFLADVAIEYNKTVLFATMQTILFNNNENILVVKE